MECRCGEKIIYGKLKCKCGRERKGWEEVAEDTYRLKVHNGWLVRHDTVKHINKGSGYSNWGEFGGCCESMTFVVDQTHQWKLDS